MVVVVVEKQSLYLDIACCGDEHCGVLGIVILNRKFPFVRPHCLQTLSPW